MPRSFAAATVVVLSEPPGWTTTSHRRRRRRRGRLGRGRRRRRRRPRPGRPAAFSPRGAPRRRRFCWPHPTPTICRLCQDDRVRGGPGADQPGELGGPDLRRGLAVGHDLPASRCTQRKPVPFLDEETAGELPEASGSAVGGATRAPACSSAGGRKIQARVSRRRDQDVGERRWRRSPRRGPRRSCRDSATIPPKAESGSEEKARRIGTARSLSDATPQGLACFTITDRGSAARSATSS